MLNGSGQVPTARRSPSMKSACAARGICGRLRGGERVSRRRSGLLLRPLRAHHTGDGSLLLPNRCAPKLSQLQ